MINHSIFSIMAGLIVEILPFIVLRNGLMSEYKEYWLMGFTLIDMYVVMAPRNNYDNFF